MRFFVCNMCGNFVEMVRESGVPMVCCGQKMKELIPSSTDGAHDKHVPICSFEGDKLIVRVGESMHPMISSHFIEWIALETNKGAYRIELKPGDLPRAVFTLAEGEKPLGAYAFCNVHGLWKSL